MEQLGLGLSAAGNDVEALSVKEAELSIERRLGTVQGKMLAMQSNLANTLPRTVNGTGHTDPSEFCATSI